jgi:IclR family transcriptional regulator, KDG regulon repressor
VQNSPRRGAQTAGRVLEMLQVIVQAQHSVSVTHLANTMGINRNAVYRALKELEDQGFVAREPGGQRYMIGSSLISMSATVLNGMHIRGAARHAMVRISDATSETVSLHVRHLRNRVCVEAVESSHLVRRVASLGSTLPLFAGPSGKVILAFLDPIDAADIQSQAARANVDLSHLETQLAGIRACGHMAAIGDRTPGIGGLAFPLFSAQGVAGSLTVSGPAERWTLESMTSAIPLIQQECDTISDLLGYSRPGLTSMATF